MLTNPTEQASVRDAIRSWRAINREAIEAGERVESLLDKADELAQDGEITSWDFGHLLARASRELATHLDAQSAILMRLNGVSLEERAELWTEGVCE